MALTVLLLPIWLGLAGLAVDAAYLYWVHGAMRAAADMAALASAQNLDLEALARGDPEILAGPAINDARAWVLANLERHPATTPHTGTAEIRVWVLNAKPDQGLLHPRTGRGLTDPTVSVEISLTVDGLLWRRALGTVPLTVRADASVMGRKR